MNSPESGNPAVPPQRWLHPWAWMLVGLAATGAALIWARCCSPEEVPLDLVQVNLIGLGVLAAGAAVWQRCAWRNAPSLQDLHSPLRERALMPLAVVHTAIAVAVIAVAFFKFNRPDLPGDIVGTILLLILTVPWCLWSAWKLFQRVKDGAVIDAPFETAVLVTQAGLVAFMGSWALWWGPDYSEEWDSLRFFLAVAAGCCFLAAPLVAAPTVGSSRVDLQACKLEYSIVSPK